MASINSLFGSQSTQSTVTAIPNASGVANNGKDSMERVAEIWKSLEVQLDSGDDFLEIDDLEWTNAWGEFEKEQVRERMM